MKKLKSGYILLMLNYVARFPYLIQLYEHTVVNLLQAEQLQYLAHLGCHLVDTETEKLFTHCIFVTSHTAKLTCQHIHSDKKQYNFWQCHIWLDHLYGQDSVPS
jgi:hypothetical protein